MTLLIIGVLLWSAAHLMRAVAPAFRQGLIDRIGRQPFRGLVALLLVGAVVLIVLGWRSTPQEYLYVLPDAARKIAVGLICISFFLIASAYTASSIKRVLRHPMLTGVFIWAGGHLLINGTTRALVLFGTLATWSLLEIFLINRREGAYVKPERPNFSDELKWIFLGAALVIVALLLHPKFAGVAVLPG